MSGRYNQNLEEDLNALKAQVSTLVNTLPSFVNDGIPTTVANLLTTFPAGSDYLYKYARVTDLYSNGGTGANSVMVCEANGSTYYWRPQRADYGANVANTSGTVTITPLVSPPVMFFTGSLLGTINVNPSATNAWPGATFTLVSKGALNLFGITINNLIGGNTIPLLQGGQRTLTYIAGSGWQAG